MSFVGHVVEAFGVFGHHVLEALGILVGGVLFYSYTYSWFPVSRRGLRRARALFSGAVFGGIALLLMISRIEIAPGVFIDARAVPVALIGLFEGWPAALLAAGIASVYRIWLGGSGALAGVVSLMLTGIAGGLVHALARRSGRLGTRHVALLTVLTFLTTVAGFAVLGLRGLRLFAPLWLAYLVMVVVGVGMLTRLLRDVTQQHVLAATQQRYRAILDEATDAIRIQDPRRQVILDANRVDCEIAGYSREELIGRGAREFWPDEPDAPRPGPRGGELARAFGVPFRKRSGEVVLVDSARRTVEYEGRRYEIIIYRDAGERLAAETARREAAELRAATLLARAAAHEIHNPLAVILGYLQLMKPRIAADSKESGWLEQMVEAVGRIQASVGRLTNLVRIESTASAGDAPVMLDSRRSADAGAAATTAPAIPPPTAPPAS
jgi:PAS domain S-box-containing protein